MSLDPLDTVSQKIGNLNIKAGDGSHFENRKIAISALDRPVLKKIWDSDVCHSPNRVSI